jgi:hypothetical protein
MNTETKKEPKLNVNELADALRHHRSYVTDMKRAGFQMEGGFTTLNAARAWLRNHPNFRTTKFRLSKSRG